jgi:hypothetical protein
MANEFHQDDRLYLNRAKVLQWNLEVQMGFHHLLDNYFRGQDILDLEEDILKKRLKWNFQKNLVELLDF